MSLRPRKRYTLRELSERPDRFRELETAAFERDYARYMDDLERGDAQRDAREQRLVPGSRRLTMSDKTTLTLTALERRTLLMAAESIGDDLNEYGLTAAEKTAYHRAIRKLKANGS